MTKAVVIFSGGQDSTTCLYWAKEKFDVVEAITFNYAQNHVVEIIQAEIICNKEEIKQKVVDISFFGALVNSALTTGGDVNVTNDKGLPASFVPNRNQMFITMAHSYAQKIGATNLVTGVCQTDYSGYPDCREKFIEALQLVTNMGSESQITIHTPLMYLTKSETFAMADKLGCLQEIIELTHTCYNGERKLRHRWGYGCGSCPACELRMKGYNDFISA